MKKVIIALVNILRSPYFWLSLIVIGGLLVRLYKIDNAIADWHSWRQADTAAVARNFYQEGFNPFLPKGDDMSAISETGAANIGRYRFVEFPIYGTLVYLGYLLNGGVSVVIARLVAVLFSLGSVVFIYFLAKRYFGVVTGLISAGLFAFLPYNIFFSRVVLPEPSLVFFCLGMVYLTDRWIFEGSRKLYFLAVFFTLAAFLTKPMAVFYLLPLVYSYYQKERRWWPIPGRYFYFLLPALLPLLAWRVWINTHPEGIPMSNWLYNGNGIRFRPSFWRWILADRFGREILGVTGTFLFFIGLIIRTTIKEKLLLHFLALSLLVYLAVFATGNVQHDYYQILIVPALVIMVARGVSVLFEGSPGLVPRIWTMPLAVLFLVLIPYFGWQEVKGLYQINNNSIVIAGERADQILPKEAIVLAPYLGDTAFLYQTNRPGFAIEVNSVDFMKKNYELSAYVAVAKDTKTAWLMKRYLVLDEQPNYVIIDLTKDNPQFNPVTASPAELTEPN